MKPELRIESELILFLLINDELILISENLEQAKHARSIFKKENDDKTNTTIVDSIKTSFYNIYSSMEEVLEKIALDIDNKKPDDENFSEELLEQMSSPTDDRIAVINLTPDLKNLMDFRNAFRNGHGNSFRSDKIFEKLDIVEYSVLPEFIQNLENLEKFLTTDIEYPVFEKLLDFAS